MSTLPDSLEELVRACTAEFPEDVDPVTFARHVLRRAGVGELVEAAMEARSVVYDAAKEADQPRKRDMRHAILGRLDAALGRFQKGR